MPIPRELSAEGSRIEEAIQQSLKEASHKKLSGADTTPFLLQRIQEITEGASLAENIKLVKNNAAVGAGIAAALTRGQ